MMLTTSSSILPATSVTVSAACERQSHQHEASFNLSKENHLARTLRHPTTRLLNGCTEAGSSWGCVLGVVG